MLKEQHKKMHEKCLRILDLMERAEKNLFEAQWMLRQHDKSNEYSTIKLFASRKELEKDLEFKKAVSDRLISYYATEMMKLIQPAAKRAFFHVHNN